MVFKKKYENTSSFGVEDSTFFQLGSSRVTASARNRSCRATGAFVKDERILDIVDDRPRGANLASII